MLFKKTLKVASATALWMVALLGANSAMAQTPPPTYSAEALTKATADAKTYGLNSSSPFADALVLSPRVMYYLQQDPTSDAGQSVHLRVAPTGPLGFTTANPPEWALDIATGRTAAGAIDWAGGTAGTLTDMSPADKGHKAAVPGATGRGDAIAMRIRISVPGDTADAVDDVTVNGMGAAGIVISLHENDEDAHFGEGDRHQSKSVTLFNVESSITAGAAEHPLQLTASAESAFTAIKGMESAPAAYEVNFGGFDIKVDGMHRKPNGMTIMEDATAAATASASDADTAADHMFDQVGIVTKTSSTTFHGDNGWAFAQGFRFAAKPADGAGSCSGAGPDGSAAGAKKGNGAGITTSPLSEVEDDEDAPDANQVIGGIKFAPWYLCVTISNDNTEVIPEGDYTLDVTVKGDPKMFRLAQPDVSSVAGVTVAVVDHDGTTVEIPYLTSYEGYTQRIVIVNRGKDDAAFTLMFRAETDEDGNMGMIEGTNPVTGTVAGHSSRVLKVDELVTLMSPTRASGTLTLVADPGHIDVATTQVNKMDQSTDTVVLESR